jgi:hypothetical protein
MSLFLPVARRFYHDNDEDDEVYINGRRRVMS